MNLIKLSVMAGVWLRNKTLRIYCGKSVEFILAVTKVKVKDKFLFQWINVIRTTPREF